MPRTFVTFTPHPNGLTFHAEKSSVVCEAPGCNKVVQINESYSFAGLFFATTGPRAISPFILEDLTEQDFCCSPECAAKALAARAKQFVAQIKKLEKTAPYQVGSGPRAAQDSAPEA